MCIRDRISKIGQFQLFSFVFIWSMNLVFGQNFEISPEINLRNDFAYYILPFGKEVSLIRDKSYKLTVQNLRADMSWTVEKDVELKGRKWRILDTYTPVSYTHLDVYKRQPQ